MTEKLSPARQAFGDIAPSLAGYTDDVLFGDVWKRPGLSPRDRSLVTITSLMSLYRVNELPFHLKLALENGVTKDEIIEVITHLAFYSGWPTANTALGIARRVFDETSVQADARTSLTEAAGNHGARKWRASLSPGALTASVAPRRNRSWKTAMRSCCTRGLLSAPPP
jgi:4-carboxymuconolactone decarboxylase